MTYSFGFFFLWCKMDTYKAAANRYEGGMLYARSGRSGVMLPKVSLGFWHHFGESNDFDNSRAIARYAFDHGITHFDLANNYGPPPGSAERTLARLLELDFAPYRDELFISTKAGYEMWPGPYGNWGSRKSLMASLDQSLERMKLDYVGPGLLTDRYLHHIPADSRMAEGRFLKPEMLTPDLLQQLRRWNDEAQAQGMTLAEMALQWVLKQNGVTSVLIGAGSVKQLEQNLKTLSW